MSTARDTVRIPGCTTPEQAERFMAGAAAAVQGSPPSAPGPAELLQEIAANKGCVPGCDTSAQLAQFVEGARRRGQPAAVVPAPRAGDLDMDTPEGMAAFILNAGKPRAGK